MEQEVIQLSQKIMECLNKWVTIEQDTELRVGLADQ